MRQGYVVSANLDKVRLRQSLDIIQETLQHTVRVYFYFSDTKENIAKIKVAVSFGENIMLYCIFSSEKTSY